MTCRWPEKAQFPTNSSAWEAARAMRKKKGASVDLLPYACEGHWHIGHSAVSLRRRFRQAVSDVRMKGRRR